MKKLTLPLLWLNILLSLGIIYFLIKQIKDLYHFTMNNQVKREILFGMRLPDEAGSSWYIIMSVVSFILLIYLVYILNIFRKITIDLSNNLIFTHENGVQMSKIGKGLLFFGIALSILKTTLNFLFYFNSSELKPHDSYEIGRSFGYTLGFGLGSLFQIILTVVFPIFIVALFLMVISYLIKTGALLKQENDLTI